MSGLNYDLIADVLLILGCIAMAIYCTVLSKRLSSLRDLDKGVGGAIAVLSVQVDDMTKTLTSAQKTAASSAGKLEDLNARAEDAAHKLELLIAATQDLPEPPETPEDTPAAEVIFATRREEEQA